MTPRGRPAAARALSWLIHERWRDDIVGDLCDEHYARGRRGDSALTNGTRLTLALVQAAIASHWQAFRHHRNPVPRHERSLMESLWQDVRYSVRSLLRAPLFTAVALATLGAGIGLTVAMFAVVNGVLLRPLDYPDPDRLVLLQGQPGARGGVSMPQHVGFRDGATGLESASAWQGWAPVLAGDDGRLQRARGASVSENFFDVVGVTAAAGRFFEAADGAPGHEPVVVLGHDVWTTQFGGEERVIGTLIELDSEPYRVVGVAPEGFSDPVARGIGSSNPTMWRAAPPTFREAEGDRGWVGFWSFGRLRPGADASAVTSQMRSVLMEGYAGDADVERYASEFRAIPVREAVVEDIRPTLRILLLGVALVLIISCVNIANLLLSRATVRRAEMAVRSSLGAGRRRLIRQLVTESVVLALGGAILGAAVGYGGSRAVVALAGSALPRSTEVQIDATVLAFALLASLLTAVFFGLVPALRATDGLVETRSRGSSASRSTGRLRRGLVVVETALAMVLLTGAGLLTSAALEIEAVETGFVTDGRATLDLDLGAERFPTPEDQAASLERIERALASMPGVTAVGAITDLPLRGAVNSTRVRRLDDTDEDAAARGNVLVRAITPGFFEVLGIPTARGTTFDREAGLGAEDVAVVNEEFERRFFPGDGALNRRVNVRGVDRRIVAVVPSVREFTLTGDANDPVLYTPYPQERESWMRSGVTLVAAVAPLTPETLDQVRSAVVAAEPRVLAGRIGQLQGVVNALKQGPRLRAWLVVAFALLALLLAAVGMGGVVAYNVSQRLNEIGIRLALGAERASVQLMVLKDTLRMSLLGVGLGLVAALAVGRTLEGFLFQVRATDPRVFSVAALALLIVAVLASWLPARRAAAVDPGTALRGE